MRRPDRRRSRGEFALVLQILQHTPPWVFALFAGLAWLGFTQRRTRQVPWPRLVILPLAMLALSFAGVWSSFGADATAFAAWAGALVAVVVVVLALPASRDAAYDRASRRLTLPGSWVPLLAMMVIFFTKYAVAVARATGAADFNVPGVCVVLGLCSGVFVARALRVARTSWQDNGVDLVGNEVG